MRVLVTDGEERSALAVVRSLGRAGHQVHVVASRSRSMAGGSRYARTESLVPDPVQDPEGFVTSLHNELSTRRAEVLLPISEASLYAVLPRRDAFKGVTIPFPDYEVFDAACDKLRTLELASDIGIAVPRQIRLERPTGKPPCQVGLRFPVVVKPYRSVVEVGSVRRKTIVRHAHDPDELAATVEAVADEAFPILVQERIRGSGTGVFLLLWDGKLYAAFCHRRIREKPPTGGVSVYRESVPLDSELVDASTELLTELGWRGVAMVEYKKERSSGTPYLMEVNGRFWGSLQLAIDAGVDFPRLLVSLANGDPVTPVLEYEAGVRSRWFWGEVDHLLAVLRGGGSPDTEEDNSGARPVSWIGACGSFLSSFRPGVKSEIFRISDPLPALRETTSWFGLVLEGRRG